jgi:hypothetical protein
VIHQNLGDKHDFMIRGRTRPVISIIIYPGLVAKVVQEFPVPAADYSKATGPISNGIRLLILDRNL